jgi:hypothetical protein
MLSHRPRPLVQVEAQGENHFAPVGNGGGRSMVGRLLTAAAVAQLRDVDLGMQAMTLFFGPDSGSIIDSVQGISFLSRNAGAQGAP